MDINNSKIDNLQKKLFEKVINDLRSRKPDIWEEIVKASRKLTNGPLHLNVNNIEELIEIGFLSKGVIYTLTNTAADEVREFLGEDDESLRKIINDLKSKHPGIFEKYKQYLKNPDVKLDENEKTILAWYEFIYTESTNPITFLVNEYLNAMIWRIILDTEP